MSEEWRYIEGCSLYEVSDRGRVRSHNHQRGLRRVPLVLTPSANKWGYWYVGIYPDGGGKKITAYIAPLVAGAFIGPRPEGMDVRHLNGDKTDNRTENLAYGTRSQNTLDQVAHGTHNMASKTHCKRGHEFTPENTYYLKRKGSGRNCVICRRAHSRAHYWRQKQEAS